MALHAGHWIQRPWLSGLRWLDTIVVRIRSANRSHASDTARPPLARGERILATSTVADQPSAIGTTHALQYHGDGWTRIGWEELDHVTWHPETGTLTPDRTRRTAAGHPAPGRTQEPTVAYGQSNCAATRTPPDVDVQCKVDAAVHAMRCDLGV